MMQASARSYRINIKNPVYAKVLSDTAEGTTYDVVKSLGEAQTMEITASVATGSLYGNGTVVDSSSKLTGLAASLSSTKIPVEAIQDIYGYTVVDGVVQVKAGDMADFIAVGYEVEQTNKKSEYVWLLKGRPRPINSSVQQSESNINYSTDTIEIDFVERISDGMLKWFADLSNPDFSEEQAAKWFTTGPASIPTK